MNVDFVRIVISLDVVVAQFTFIDRLRMKSRAHMHVEYINHAELAPNRQVS